VWLGVSAEEAAPLLQKARTIPSKHPNDERVLAVLAKAELTAGNDPAAITAAQRALTLNPRQPEALQHKGVASFNIARTMADTDQSEAAYRDAMAPLRTLGELEPDHTVPLIYTYRAQAERGLTPNEEAKAAYLLAAELAPFDEELWLISGMIHMNGGRIADARAALQPVASNPHGGEKAEQIRQLLAFLNDKPEGQPIPVQAAISAYFADE